jgi:hypothetical protein
MSESEHRLVRSRAVAERKAVRVDDGNRENQTRKSKLLVRRRLSTLQKYRLATERTESCQTLDKRYWSDCEEGFL